MHNSSISCIPTQSLSSRAGTRRQQESIVEFQWSTDTELFSLMRKRLFPAVVGDVMDAMNLRHQFLPPRIRPIDPCMVIAGRAMTVLSHDVHRLPESHQGGRSAPFGLMMRALDSLQPDEAYVCTGGLPAYALWGELMSRRARHLKAAGAVLNGYHRDTQGILDVAFPTFSIGAYAQDQGLRGQVVDFRVPIALGQAVVHPGDIVFGDRDGVCAIPKQAETEVLQAAWTKCQGENAVRDAIDQGMGAEAAFRKYGIL